MSSEPAGFYSIVNYERFQHYKDRNPPWIKLHASTLDDYAFVRLPDAQKWQLVGLWVLASKMENRIPMDDEWIAQKIGATAPLDMQLLIDREFVMLARRKQDSSAAQAKCPPRRGEKRRDRGEKKQSAAGAASWVVVLGDLWKASRGKPPYPRIGKALKDLVTAHGLRQVRMSWEGYLQERAGKSFASPEDFASNYRVYREKYAVIGNAAGDGGFIPVPDEPEAAA